jgi:hypothetical protein
MIKLTKVLIVKDHINKIRIFDSSTEKVVYEYLNDFNDSQKDIIKIVEEKYGKVLISKELKSLHPQLEMFMLVEYDEC